MNTDIYNKIASGVDELLSPQEIATNLGLQVREVIEHLFVIIGEGRVKQSDLLFILAKKYSENKDLLDKFAEGESSVEKLRLVMEKLDDIGMFEVNSEPEELVLYISYRRRRVYLGDLYVFITDLERLLHEKVKSILIRKYGADEAQWWKEGVPPRMREKCAVSRQQDAQFESHEYSYTTLIDLKEILDSKKSVFFSRLPQAVVTNNNNIKDLLNDLVRLNGIRNQVMHPVREQDPTEQDFLFVRQIHNRLCPSSLWR